MFCVLELLLSLSMKVKKIAPTKILSFAKLASDEKILQLEVRKI